MRFCRHGACARGCQSRVGCAPCILARQADLYGLAHHYPRELARVGEWERRVGRVNKRQATSFFAVDKIPGPHQGAPSLPVPKMDEVAGWAIQESPILDLFEDSLAPDGQLGYCE